MKFKEKIAAEVCNNAYGTLSKHLRRHGVPDALNCCTIDNVINVICEWLLSQECGFRNKEEAFDAYFQENPVQDPVSYIWS